MEEVVAYAKLTGMDLKALRAYVGERSAEAAKSSDGRIGAHASARWTDLTQLMDGDDLELVVRAHTERLPRDGVAHYLENRNSELVGLLDAPFESVVGAVKRAGRALGRLRAYAARRAEEAGRDNDARAGAAGAAYWQRMVSYIDGR